MGGLLAGHPGQIPGHGGAAATPSGRRQCPLPRRCGRSQTASDHRRLGRLPRLARHHGRPFGGPTCRSRPRRLAARLAIPRVADSQPLLSRPRAVTVRRAWFARGDAHSANKSHAHCRSGRSGKCSNNSCSWATRCAIHAAMKSGCPTGEPSRRLVPAPHITPQFGDPRRRSACDRPDHASFAQIGSNTTALLGCWTNFWGAVKGCWVAFVEINLIVFQMVFLRGMLTRATALVC